MDDLALSNIAGVGPLPGVNLQFVMELLAGLFLASLRIGAFLIASPFFGGSAVPLQVRIIMAVLLGVAVVTTVEVPDWQAFAGLNGIQVILTELAIGISSGLILTIWFSAALLAGEKIASSAGLGFAAQIDPDSGGQTPVVSKTFSLFLTVIFLSWNGHLLVLRAVADSYTYLPVGAMPAFPVLIQSGIAAAGSMFFAATIIMLPLTAFLMAINLVIGVITRSAPQLNLFSFGFPISMIGIFVLLYLWVDVLGGAMDDLSHAAAENIQLVLGAMING
ncbi:flagellar biosynthetic protein FliR [Alphaproteobacteria bacterium]|nr:flagellar biosynthetic protein FliR [Alphaproteobacteria bacterium]MDB0016215.1 flagellar biosynthetic protein FliR [Alphaproteobacteria bacterium]MDC0458861.1 flagellar biosynthetic protein FliR [Alphaproteobacteria bacterium]MDC1051286.1 flagellar biosynthetic protein FliR [bacterium]